MNDHRESPGFSRGEEVNGEFLVMLDPGCSPKTVGTYRIALGQLAAWRCTADHLLQVSDLKGERIPDFPCHLCDGRGDDGCSSALKFAAIKSWPTYPREHLPPEVASGCPGRSDGGRVARVAGVGAPRPGPVRPAAVWFAVGRRGPIRLPIRRRIRRRIRRPCANNRPVRWPGSAVDDVGLGGSLIVPGIGIGHLAQRSRTPRVEAMADDGVQAAKKTH